MAPPTGRGDVGSHCDHACCYLQSTSPGAEFGTIDHRRIDLPQRLWFFRSSKLPGPLENFVLKSLLRRQNDSNRRSTVSNNGEDDSRVYRSEFERGSHRSHTTLRGVVQQFDSQVASRLRRKPVHRLTLNFIACTALLSVHPVNCSRKAPSLASNCRRVESDRRV